jgi:hypothetical protein
MSSTSSSSLGIVVLAGYYLPQHVLHFQCYAATSASSSFASDHRAAADCCTSILRAQSRLQHAINKEVQEGREIVEHARFGVGRILPDFSVVECKQNLLPLRHPPPTIIGQSWLLGMMTHTPNKTATRKLESDEQADLCTKVEDQTVVQGCSWRWFLWNGTAGDDSGHWIFDAAKEADPSNSSKIMSAAWIPTYSRANPADDEPQIHQSSSNDFSSFIHLSSTLSKTGGMHRELRQRLVFSLPGETSSAAAAALQYDYSIDVLLSIPSGLFINVEDASFTTIPGMKIAVSSISSSNSSRGGSPGARTVGGNTENSTIDTTILIIDQEEPAFVSPCHLVLCRLTGPLASAPGVDSDGSSGGDGDQGPDFSLPTTTTVELTWDTHLHVRYPLPIRSSHHHDYYSQISFMLPMIVAGEIVDRKTNHSYTLASATSADAAAAAATSVWILLPQRQAPHTLWVAAGHQDDFGPVFVLTLLAALIGTIVLLRDMMLLYNQDDASSLSRTRTASKTKGE